MAWTRTAVIHRRLADQDAWQVRVDSTNMSGPGWRDYTTWTEVDLILHGEQVFD